MQRNVTFSVPIKNKIDNGKSITYKLKSFDSFRFMSSLLSNLLNNLSEGLHCDKYIESKSFLEYMWVKDNQLIFRWFECRNNYKKEFNKELKTKSLKTSCGKTMILSKCAVCGSKKARFIEEQEPKGILSSLSPKTPSTNIPLLGYILF